MMYEQLMNQISLNKKGRMLYQISHCAGHVSANARLASYPGSFPLSVRRKEPGYEANARPCQLYWRDKENGDSCLMQETKPE